MSETKKSNAPWILGLVGFGLSLPQIVCSILCAAAAAEASKQGAETEGWTLFFLMPVILTIVCFILSFLGKSKMSMITGILLILGGLGDAYACWVNISYLGIAAGICFFCAGISSVCNAKKGV